MDTQYLPYRSKMMIQITLECAICHRRLVLKPTDLPNDATAREQEYKSAADAAGWVQSGGNYYCRRHAYNIPSETK